MLKRLLRAESSGERARAPIERLDGAHYEIFTPPLFLPDAAKLGFLKATEKTRLAVRMIAFGVPALVACGFFLYVLIEFWLARNDRDTAWAELAKYSVLTEAR